jgi:hypothetical protein
VKCRSQYRRTMKQISIGLTHDARPDHVIGEPESLKEGRNWHIGVLCCALRGTGVRDADPAVGGSISKDLWAQAAKLLRRLCGANELLDRGGM